MSENVFSGRTSMFLLGATLALGFTVSSYVIGRAAVRVTQPNHIFVKGTAAKTVRSDFGVWSSTICVRTPTLAEGYRKLAEDQKKVTDFLLKQGFGREEFAFESISISENRKRDARGNLLPQVENYSLSRTVTVSSEKVDVMERSARELTSLVRENVFIRSGSTSFVIRDLDRYKMELLANAAKNASERARVLAGNSGGKVGGLVSARQGVFQITAPASGSTSDGGEYDKSTIQKEIRAVVTLQFKVE